MAETQQAPSALDQMDLDTTKKVIADLPSDRAPTKEEIDGVRGAAIQEIKDELLDSKKITPEQFEKIRKKITETPENELKKFLEEDLLKEVDNANMWLFLNGNSEGQEAAFTALCNQLNSEKKIVPIGNDLPQRISALPGITVKAQKSVVEAQARNLVRKILEKYPKADGLKINDDNILHAFQRQQDLGPAFAEASTPGSTDGAGSALGTGEGGSSAEAPKSAEQGPFVVQDVKPAIEKLTAHLKKLKEPMGFSTEDLPIIEGMTPGQTNALKAIFLKIKEKFPNAKQIRFEKHTGRHPIDGEMQIIEDGKDWKEVKIPDMDVAPPLAKPSEGDPSINQSKLSAERIALITALGKEEMTYANLEKANPQQYPEIIKLINGQFNPKPTSIKFLNGALLVFVGTTAKPEEKTWQEVKSLGLKPAETYLSTMERFNAKIEEKTEGFLFKIAQMLAQYFFHTDVKELIKDKGVLGSLFRMCLKVDINKDDIPQMTPALSKSLAERIAAVNGTPLPLDKIDGEARDDPKVKGLFRVLGAKFNQPGFPVDIVEAKTKGVADPKDKKHPKETSGSMILQVSNPDQAAAIVAYAQRSSGRFTDMIKTFADKAGGVMGGLFTSAAPNASQETNLSIRKDDKWPPDTVVSTYQGIVNQKHQIEITWISNGNIQPVETVRGNAPGVNTDAELAENPSAAPAEKPAETETGTVAK